MYGKVKKTTMDDQQHGSRVTFLATPWLYWANRRTFSSHSSHSSIKKVLKWHLEPRKLFSMKHILNFHLLIKNNIILLIRGPSLTFFLFCVCEQLPCVRRWRSGWWVTCCHRSATTSWSDLPSTTASRSPYTSRCLWPSWSMWWGHTHAHILNNAYILI